MKISLAKFYYEVTGHKSNRYKYMESLRRWGVPFDDKASAQSDVVDIVHIEPAKACYAAELAVEQQVKKPQRRSTKARIDEVDKMLQDVASAIIRVEDIGNRILRRLGP